MVKVLLSEDEKERRFAVRAIRQFGGQSEIVIPALTDALSDSQSVVRAEAAGALGEYRHEAKDSFRQVLALTNDENPEVRAEAVKAIVNIDPEDFEIEPTIEKLMLDPEPKVRIAACEAAGMLGPFGLSLSVQLENTLASDADGYVKFAAARALFEISNDRVKFAEDLEPILSDSNWQVREDVAKALGDLGRDALTALDTLKRMSTTFERSPSVRSAASEAVEKIEQR
ncbi:MAG: HEAT repeat domain-containing protein [Planctomycetes bacterium]|nr:HEAT repeat domain-containing protein [Planctomycetota bacterium]